MTTSRREFLKRTSGLVVIIGAPSLGCGTKTPAARLAPNQWLEVGSDDRVVMVLGKCEMGQGVTAALPMIMAEELGAAWSQVEVRQAKPGPDFSDMGTSGSGSVVDNWTSHRVAAAAARSMLVGAAAARWGVAPESCSTRDGFVHHESSNRRIRFGGLVDAARALPVPAEPTLKPANQYRLLGGTVPDSAAPAIVTGRTTFGIDVRVPGMVFATIRRSPVPGATVGRVDDRRALAHPGVSRVVRTEAGVAVVADSTWAAIGGRDALDVEWVGGNRGFDNAAGWRMLEAALDRGGKRARGDGNARAAVAGAARRLEAEYRWTWQAHAAIEPLSCVAQVQGGGCEIWAGTQQPNGAQRLVAQALGVPQERVTINVIRMGGAFGRRIAVDHILEAARLAQTIGAPVQVVWTREDDFRHDYYGPAQLNRLAAGLDSAGRVTGLIHRVADFHLSMFGAYNPNNDPAADGDPWGGFDNPYAIDNLTVELAVVESPVPTGAWRAVSYPAAVMARESFLDEIARATGRDPLAMRLEMIASPGIVRRGTLAIPNGDRLRRVLTTAAERAGWAEPLPARSDGRRAGRGIACNPYHRGTMVAQVAEVSVGDDGDLRVERIVTAVDCGVAVDRAGVEKQIEGGIAWALTAALGPGVRFAEGETVTTTFADYPLLRIDRMPRVESVIVAGAERPFGMGEPPVPAVAPAVFNAVFAATGVRVRALPFEPATLARRT